MIEPLVTLSFCFNSECANVMMNRWAEYLSTWSHLGVVQTLIGTSGSRASRPRLQNMLKVKSDRKKAIIAQLQQSRATGFSWLLRMRYPCNLPSRALELECAFRLVSLINERSLCPPLG
jgi:hypothetical protein